MRYRSKADEMGAVLDTSQYLNGSIRNIGMHYHGITRAQLNEAIPEEMQRAAMDYWKEQ